MASAPNPGPSATTAVLASVAALGIWRLLAVAAPHLAALALMYETETDFGSRLCFLLAWGILNFFWIALLRRPALSGALSLTMVVVLVLLSRLKHDVVQMTVNFIDLMMIDRDTVAFLFTIFPNLRWSVIGGRSRHAAADVCAVVARSVPHPPPAGARLQARLPRRAGRLFRYHPDEAWRGYYDDGYLSKFFRSGVTAVSDFVQYGFMESAAVDQRAAQHAAGRCLPSRRPAAEHHHDP